MAGPLNREASVPRFSAGRGSCHGYHKRFEGAISYSVSMPPVVDWSDMPDPLDRQPSMQSVHELNLYCYVLGNSRQHQWKAATAEVLFAAATKEFMCWVEEAVREHAEEGDG